MILIKKTSSLTQDVNDCEKMELVVACCFGQIGPNWIPCKGKLRLCWDYAE